MSGCDDPIPGIKRRVKTLRSYSGLHEEAPTTCIPANLPELRRVFAHAHENKLKITLRGGAHAFDDQSLGKCIVVSMEKFVDITVDRGRSQVWVQAGASWGAILAKLKPHGLVPAGTVTTSHATAGGTLAADCLSRFAPRYGKEATKVETFSLLTVNGNLLECTRPPHGVPAAAWTNAQAAFMAAIGGFGYLGAIVDITYNVLSIGDSTRRVLTRVQKHTSFAGLANALVPATRATRHPSHPKYPGWDAISAGLYPAGQDTESWMLFTSEFTTKRWGRPFLLHQPRNPIRIIGEWLMRVPALCRLLSRAFFRLTRNNGTYVDSLEGFMFFMDGNVNAKRIAEWFRFRQTTVQQTFVVPVDLAEDAPETAEDTLVRWLNLARLRFKDFSLTPTLQDVLFLPKDLPFLLSPNAGRDTFAVSYAFATSDQDTIDRVGDAFIQLSKDLWSGFDGRVSLVKNVQADPTTLQAMYGGGAVAFFDLKRTLDPDCILWNDFLQRTFATLAVGCP